MLLRIVLSFFLIGFIGGVAASNDSTGDVEKTSEHAAQDKNNKAKPSVKELLGNYSGEDILDAVSHYNNTIAPKEEKIVCRKNKVFGLNRSGLVCSRESELEKNGGKMSDEDMDKIITAYNAMMKDRKQLVCKREKVTGTRLSKRVCRSKWHIAQDKLKAQDMLKDLDRRKQPKWDPDYN